MLTAPCWWGHALPLGWMWGVGMTHAYLAWLLFFLGLVHTTPGVDLIPCGAGPSSAWGRYVHPLVRP